MRIKNVPLKAGSLLLAAIGTTTSGMVSASGFAIIENSASGMGNSFAGAAAVAEDASTVWFNPAGMTRLKNEMVFAGHIILPSADYTDGSSTSALGGQLDPTNTDRTGSGGHNALVPNFYWVKQLSENFRFGLGLNAPFGLSVEYSDDWVGRYHGVLSDMATYNINPSIAYKMGGFSLGFGVNAQYVEVDLTSAIDLGAACVGAELASQIPAGTCASVGATPQGSDGFAELHGDGWSYNYNIGLLFEFSEASRVGLSYRSGIDHDVEGNADFTVPGNLSFLTASGNFLDTTLSASVSLPSVTSLSYFQQVGEKFSLLFDYSVTSWSDFEELRIVYDSAQADTVTTEEWVDTTRVSIGMNYRASEKWLYRFGVAYDETPIPSAERRTPRIPGNDRTWISVGATHQIDKERSFSIAYAHLFVDETDINNTYEAASAPVLEHTLNGSYEAAVDIISAQFAWKY